MNLRLLSLASATVLFGTFLFTNAVPIKVSRWRNATGGSIVVFHDDHRIVTDESERMKLEISHANAFSAALIHRIGDQKMLHLLTEDFEHNSRNKAIGVLLKNLNPDAIYTGFIQSIGYFEERGDFKGANVSFCSMESRNLKAIFSMLPFVLNHLTNPHLYVALDDELRQGYQFFNIQVTMDPYLKNVCFADLYTTHVARIQQCILSANQLSRCIFETLQTQILESIQIYKKKLAEFGISENQKCVPCILELFKTQRPDVLEFMLSSQETDSLCQHIIEANCIQYLMRENFREEDFAFFLGFEHAQNLERFLPQLGYVCCSKTETKADGVALNPDIYHKIFAMPDVCEQCLCGGAKFKCSRCKIVSYCSQECQAKNWPSHKQICSKK